MKPLLQPILGLLFATVASAAIAQSNESCSDILRYASRDVRKDVSFSDQRKFFYEKICKSDDTGAGLSYGDAASALGVSYSSKTEYCSAEENITKNTNYTFATSSTVVRNSLDAYVACRALSGKGVDLAVTYPPTDNPVVFSISARRRSATPQTVTTLSIDPTTVTCNALKADGTEQELNKTFNAINFALPESEAAWSLSCMRTAVLDGSGNKTYAPTQLILATSAGELPLALPATGYAAGAWASELRSSATSQDRKLTALQEQLSGQRIIAQCGKDNFFPRNTPAPVCPANFKDSGVFRHSSIGGGGGYGGECRICLGN